MGFGGFTLTLKILKKNVNVNKKIILITCILFLLVIAGCTGGSRNKSPITDVDVRSGTDGLIMEFAKNAPPKKVFEDSVFPIAINLKNRGAFDIGSEIGEFAKDVKKANLVFGFEKTYVDVVKEEKVKKIDEKIKELPLGVFEEYLMRIHADEIATYNQYIGCYMENLRDLDPERYQEQLINAFSVKYDEFLESTSYESETEIVIVEFEKYLKDSFADEIVPYNQYLKCYIDGLRDPDPETYKVRLIGGFSVIYDEFLVSGFAAKFVESEERKIFEINGKSIFNPNGDQDLKTINAQTKKIGAQSETQPSTILATACYPYETILGTSVCIDTDIYGQRRGKKVCKITDLNFGEGQGAPVAITKVETRMLPEDKNKVKPHFLIHIENKGNGEVVELSKVEQACTNVRLDYKAFNTITIKASLSGKPLDCRIGKNKPEPAVIRLRDKENLVRCILEGPSEELIDISRDAYIAPLRIELDYGYTFTISKDIIIEKILTY